LLQSTSCTLMAKNELFSLRHNYSKQESCCYEHAALQRTLQAMCVPARAELPHITVESIDQSLCNEAFYIHGWVQGVGGGGGGGLHSLSFSKQH
jgi:hypothetical protein